MTTQVSSISSGGGGPQLLLLSIAGAGTAACISFTRWLLTETGEIMILFSDGNGQQYQYCNAAPRSGGVNENVIYQEISDNTIIGSCIPSPTTTTSSTTQLIGQSLLTISSSPYLRSIPIFLVLLSSTTFLIGILLTQKQLSRFISNYQMRMKTNVISIVKIVFGEEVGDELEVQQPSLGEVLTNVMTIQKQQVGNRILMKLDNLVMDEYVQWFIQNGVEMMLGLGGGIALYSLPETVFYSGDGDNDDDDRKKGAIVRQRLIHAADPWLERVLFQPGGMWDVLPNGCRELLTADSEKKQGVTVKMVGDSLDTTQETLAGTETSAESVGSTDNETDDGGGHEDEFASTPTRHAHAHAPPISSVELKTTNGDMRNPNESIGEALYATICDVVASNLTNAFQSKGASTSSPRHVREEKEDRNRQPSPQEQIEKILHRTTIAATTIFLCQFFTSRSTRRSWMSAIKFLTSAGLFSTAISAGVASHLLRSSDTTTSSASTLLFGESAMMTILCSKIHDWIQLTLFPLYSSLPTSVHLETVTSKMRVMFHRLREEITKNKRLQATVALMILYGVKQLPGRKRNIRSGGVRSRRVR